MKPYNLVIASDHAGYNLKAIIITHIQNRNLSVQDLGTTNSEEKVDYPDYAYKVVEALIEESAPFGILICGTGIGMSIAANRNSKIRAALCTDIVMAEMARAHNNANILVLGDKIIDKKAALQIVDKFLSTNFEGGRHNVRLSKIH